MNTFLQAFSAVPQLSKTDLAYLSADPALRPFYEYDPTLASFPEAIRRRGEQNEPGEAWRQSLAQVLREQYSGLPDTEAVMANINALEKTGCFTVTTAHQPSLLLGPLYYLYKAITTIQLAEAVTAQGQARVLPVFVLGSEDHDIEELNHVSLFNNSLIWTPAESGAVGSMPNTQVLPLLAELKTMLGESENAHQLLNAIETAYQTRRNFAAATQALLHFLFGRFGLLVLDTNHPVLKQRFIPVMADELLQRSSLRLINETIADLQTAGFKTQAAPREINLFYMRNDVAKPFRERIVLENERYAVLNTDFSFDEADILQELQAHPERFSPNVVLRPVYQEMILPNVAYVGGGGELAYWLERKRQFEHYNLHFPVLVRRHSVLWIEPEGQKKWQKLGFSWADLFAETEALVKQYIAAHAAAEISLQTEMADLQEIYERLATKAARIDPTLEKSLRADAVKAQAGLEQWQSRLVRAEKQKHEVALNQLRAVKAKLFPNDGLQERSDNFIPYYLKHGAGFIDALKEELKPFAAGFVVLLPS